MTLREERSEPIRLREAEERAARFVELIKGYCDRVQVAGSIRRKVPYVHDLDVVAISKTAPNLIGQPQDLLPGRIAYLRKHGQVRARVKKDGKTMVGMGVAALEYEGTPTDLYYANARTWGGLLLIRTGSTDHNIRLVSMAKERGWFLHADGTGLFDTRSDCDADHSLVGSLCARCGGRRLDTGTERSFFDALGINYVEPEGRS